MICNNCKRAADVSIGIENTTDERSKLDYKNMVKALHAKCQYPDCYCQHRSK